mmetsp:Transcript_15521/g.26299  ORF Transcript_15521/g.26299 Transcript_15521/m.26299 type:complete len:82 (+) Transcript_15521:176-421(+)
MHLGNLGEILFWSSRRYVFAAHVVNQGGKHLDRTGDSGDRFLASPPFPSHLLVIHKVTCRVIPPSIRKTWSRSPKLETPSS